MKLAMIAIIVLSSLQNRSLCVWKEVIYIMEVESEDIAEKICRASPEEVVDAQPFGRSPFAHPLCEQPWVTSEPILFSKIYHIVVFLPEN